MKEIGYAAAWIGTSAAVIAGIYFTGSPNCLWALLIPAMVSGLLYNNRNFKVEDKDAVAD